MTVRFCYHTVMNLLSVQAQGFAWIVLLFITCVIVVHGIKLAVIGFRSLHKKLPPEPPKQPEKKPEPVYFIVERKKKRTKSEYSAPREVKFK